MKLKGLTKLVLAGTALAATAATLTTSTYAWYVTNNKVEATGVSGATAGDSVAGSLLISQNSASTTPLNYTTKINLTSDVQATALVPQTKAPKDSSNYYYVTTASTPQSGTKYYTANTSLTSFEEATSLTTFASNTVYYEASPITDGQVWVDKEGKKIDSPTTVKFSFWLKSSSTMDGVSVYTKFANTATDVVAAAKKQTFYAGTGLPTGMVKGDTFAVDAVYALRMEVEQQAYTITGATPDTYTLTADTTALADKDYYTRSGDAEPYTYTKMTSVEVGVTDVTGKYEFTAATNGTSTKTSDAAVIKENGCVENHNACYTDAADKYKSPQKDSADIFDDHTGGDANIYYKTVMQSAGWGTTAGTGVSPTLSSSNWTSLDLAKDVDNLITITIWLEGTDAQCWDSCIGQGFSLELLFEKVGA